MCRPISLIMSADSVFTPTTDTWNHSHSSIAAKNKLPDGQIGDKYARVEKLLGIADLPAAIEALNQKLNIPCCFQQCDEVDFDESKFRDVLERMSQNAHADPCTWTNPGKPTVSDVKALYEAAFYGEACCEA